MPYRIVPHLAVPLKTLDRCFGVCTAFSVPLDDEGKALVEYRCDFRVQNCISFPEWLIFLALYQINSSLLTGGLLYQDYGNQLRVPAWGKGVPRGPA
jgi:hypothetical protein